MSTTWVFKQANIGIACEQAHDWATKKKESRESQGRYREEKMAASFSNPFFFFMFIDSLHFPNFFPSPGACSQVLLRNVATPVFEPASVLIGP